MKNKIYFVEHATCKVPWLKEHKDVFKYNKQGNWFSRQVQKMCFWALRKCKAYYNEAGEAVQIKTHKIDPEATIQAILNQMDNLNYFWRYRPETLLIGADTYAGLMNDIDTFRQSQLIETHYYTDDNFGRRIHGLKIQIIPWMRGMLVMPNKTHCQY